MYYYSLQFYYQTLFILALPHIMPFEVEENINVMDSIQMTCHVSKGDQPVKIMWTFNGQSVTPRMGINTQDFGKRTSLLSIQSVLESHSGNYTCTARNSAGSVNHTVEVYIKGTVLSVAAGVIQFNNLC